MTTGGLPDWVPAPSDGLSDPYRAPQARVFRQLMPRGLVGRLDKILGCRALTLLMDGAGHPLLVETARGDQHLTLGAPSIIARYEKAAGKGSVATLIIDREGMSADFLNAMQEKRNVITLLRSNQYKGVDSFSNVGEFVPLLLDQDGQVIREVAPAQYPIAMPEQPDVKLVLSVALIRDWSKSVPVLPAADAEAPRWDDDLEKGERWRWLQGEFEATPAPLSPTQPKLIPIISTSHELSPLELATTYRQRWSAQENIIRDFLLPLGLDTNHGYAKTEVENSEVAKVRVTLQKRLEKARTRAEKAHRQSDWNSKRYHQLWDSTKQYSAQQAQRLKDYAQTLAAQGLPPAECEQAIRREQQAIDRDSPSVGRKFIAALTAVMRPLKNISRLPFGNAKCCVISKPSMNRNAPCMNSTIPKTRSCPYSNSCW
jgi:hypothetical protein